MNSMQPQRTQRLAKERIQQTGSGVRLDIRVYAYPNGHGRIDFPGRLDAQAFRSQMELGSAMLAVLDEVFKQAGKKPPRSVAS